MPTSPGQGMFNSLSCFQKSCKTTLNTTTQPATECVCGHLFCLKHRHPSDHDCSGPAPRKPALLASSNTTLTKDKLLLRLKEWSSSRKSSSSGGDKPKNSLLKGLMRTKSNQANSTVVQRGLEIGRLRKEAKGDTKTAEDKRIYVHGEGPPNLNAPLTSAAQVLRKPVFFSRVRFSPPRT